jgi:hypothetical protein
MLAVATQHAVNALSAAAFQYRKVKVAAGPPVSRRAFGRVPR